MMTKGSKQLSVHTHLKIGSKSIIKSNTRGKTIHDLKNKIAEKINTVYNKKIINQNAGKQTHIANNQTIKHLHCYMQINTYTYIDLLICYSFCRRQRKTQLRYIIIHLNLCMLTKYAAKLPLIAGNTNHVFVLAILRKSALKFYHLYNWNYIQGSGIACYASYIHSRTMYAVLMERAWKDDSKHTKYWKSPKYRLGFRNKASCWYSYM